MNRLYALLYAAMNQYDNTVQFYIACSCTTAFYTVYILTWDHFLPLVMNKIAHRSSHCIKAQNALTIVYTTLKSFMMHLGDFAVGVYFRQPAFRYFRYNAWIKSAFSVKFTLDISGINIFCIKSRFFQLPSSDVSTYCETRARRTFRVKAIITTMY